MLASFSPIVLAVGVAASVVIYFVLLFALLRHLGVPLRFLGWTLLAHIAFIVLLGFTVSTKPVSRFARRNEAITVVMLPPIVEPSEETASEEFVVPETMLRVVPEPELPRNQQGTTAASELLGNPAVVGSAAARLQALSPWLRPSELGALGTRVGRPETGEVGGTSMKAEPTDLPHLATDEGPRPLMTTEPGKRTTRVVQRRTGSGRVAAPPTSASSSGRSRSLALPEGIHLVGGEAKGRAIRYLPDPPTAKGTEAGTVKLSFTVLPDGSVGSIRVLETSGRSQLDRLARDYVKRMKFAALPTGVEQVNQKGEIEVEFKKE